MKTRKDRVIDKMIETLKYYASKKNWSTDDWGCLAVIGDEYGNPGKRARSVLAKARAVGIGLKKE